jgi:hypothetical protein
MSRCSLCGPRSSCRYVEVTTGREEVMGIGAPWIYIWNELYFFWKSVIKIESATSPNYICIFMRWVRFKKILVAWDLDIPYINVTLALTECHQNQQGWGWRFSLCPLGVFYTKDTPDKPLTLQSDRSRWDNRYLETGTLTLTFKNFDMVKKIKLTAQHSQFGKHSKLSYYFTKVYMYKLKPNRNDIQHPGCRIVIVHPG